MSISASLDHVAKNLGSYPALAEELQILRRQTEVGSLRMALTDWANRIDTPEVRQVATLLARGDRARHVDVRLAARPGRPLPHGPQAARHAPGQPDARVPDVSAARSALPRPC